MPFRALTLLLCTLLLAGCGGDRPAYQQTFPALGTLITVEIHDLETERAARATAALDDYFARIGHEWYGWGDGELARINAALVRGDPARVSGELEALIRRAITLRDRSDGFFDPTVGLLVEAWGFNDSTRPPVTPPSAAWLAEWRAQAADRASLAIENGVIRASGPVKLALGGIAKGTALAAAIQLMRDHDIDNALIDAGGDLMVIGSPGDRPWRIGIRDPHSDGVLAVVELAPGEAILSSGDYERYFELNGQRYHHLLDPHTGYPVAHTAGVSVIHADAELADAAATALMAAGPERFAELTGQLEIRLALLVTSSGEILATDGMRARLDAAGHNRE